MSHFTEPTLHRANKTHVCCWCYQAIVPGEQYKRYRYYDGGDASTVKLHAECFGAMREEAAEWGSDFEWTPGQERPARAA